MVTELPYSIGPEKVMARIKDLVQAKKLNGISDLKDLTDRHRGLHLVIEIRSGFNPDAVLAELYRLTPMEETFGINNVALVDGQPRVLGLRELLEIYVAHRLEVTRRRTEYRRRKRAERLHLVDGLLIALVNIDEVIAVIRASDDAAAAKQRLMETFELSEIQAQYILDTPLRRLTRYDRLELEREQDTLRAEIAALTEILESDALLRALVSDELAEVAKKFGTPRRTVLLEGGGEARAAAVPLEVADDPCVVLMSATGLVARAAVSRSPNGSTAQLPERTVVPPPGDADSLGAGRGGGGGPGHRAGHHRGGDVGGTAGQAERARAARAAARRRGGLAGGRHGGHRVHRAGGRAKPWSGCARSIIPARGWRWAPPRAWSSGCCRTTRRPGTSSS